MKNTLVLLAALALSPLALADQTVAYPKEASQISFAVPEGWSVKFDDAGLMITPAADDDSVIIEVMDLDAAANDLDAAVAEAKETMDDFKNLKYDEMQKGESNGLGISILNATGEDEHGKAFINLVLITKAGSKNFFLLSCISSKEGSDKHGAAVNGVIQTLKARTLPPPPSL